ncbi:hypothetical protein ACFYOY_13400 [Streptomyces sp. NPDC007875]|uniref:hypothetical protein n=1 Tax=Streptomyces sp. NPDC007875 TaxID=3364783 RepID=UPI003694CF26
MSIETTPSTQPDEAWEKVIAGELVTPVDDEEDIAPGVIEVVPNRAPAVYRAGSAAMLVAAKTGRAVGLVAHPLCVGLQWFGTGVKATSILGWRYVRAHDHQEVLGGMSSDTDWNKVERTRVKRWKILGWTALAAATLNTAGWTALVAAADMDVLEALTVAPGSEVAVASAVMTLYGRYRINHPGIPAGQILADEDQESDDPDEPFPLAWCTDGQQVEECVSRALYAEGIETRSIRLLASHSWGWEVDITLKGSTPGKVNAVADQLDTHFDIAQGGTLIEPDPERSAHITLRLVTSDPFANMPRPTVHTPNSLSVKDVVVYGQGMDGSPLEFRLQGLSMLVIGSSGSAKTKGALRSLAEAITACRDAIAIEMDPAKDGLTEFEGIMAAPPIRGGNACTEWLSHLVQIARARNKVKSRLDMGDLWKPSREYPSIFGIVDEFIYLPPEAKELAIELLRLGRETGVHLIFAAQEATEDALGDAIASAVTYRIMLASRSEDVRLAFGKGASADGYRPDRLRPAVDEVRVYDAGKFYIKGPGFLRPIQWRWHRLERDQIRQAVADREAAGRPWFDHDSLAEADLLHVICRDGGASSTTADRLDGLDDPRAGTVAALLRLFDSRGSDWLPTSLIVGAGVATDATELQADLAGLVRGAVSTRQDTGGGRVRGWERAVAEQAAAALFAPSRTPS